MTHSPRPGTARPPGPPPRYKTAVVTWFSVYPTITLLVWILWPAVEGFPLPVRTLLLSLVMVPLMVWLVMPWVTSRFAFWLFPERAGTGAPADPAGRGR